MKSGYTMQEFQGEVERRERLKEDYHADTRALTMISDDNIALGNMSFDVRPTAHRQVANWAGIPLKYYNKMTEIPGLRAHNVNHWLQASDDKRMVRTMGGHTRAFLSDRYMPIDNMQVMDATAPVFADFPGLRAHSLNLSDDGMYVQLIFPRLEGAILGQTVQAGVCLTNSETGQGAVDVQTMIWTLACRNGMVAGSIIRRNHVGRRIGGEIQDYAIFQEDTIAAELESYKLRIRDVLRTALSDASWQTTLATLQAKAGQPVTRPEAAVENVTRRYTFTQNERDGIMNHFIEGGQLNRWGLTSAITRAAQDVESADRAFEMERAGWDLSNIVEGEFEKLNEPVKGKELLTA
jgi:hypothetical protein